MAVPEEVGRMLLTITTTNRPADDLGFLLHKHPDRFQSFDLSFGKAHVFNPEVGAERCTAWASAISSRRSSFGSVAASRRS